MLEKVKKFVRDNKPILVRAGIAAGTAVVGLVLAALVLDHVETHDTMGIPDEWFGKMDENGIQNITKAEFLEQAAAGDIIQAS